MKKLLLTLAALLAIAAPASAQVTLTIDANAYCVDKGFVWKTFPRDPPLEDVSCKFHRFEVACSGITGSGSRVSVDMYVEGTTSDCIYWPKHNHLGFLVMKNTTYNEIRNKAGIGNAQGSEGANYRWWVDTNNASWTNWKGWATTHFDEIEEEKFEVNNETIAYYDIWNQLICTGVVTEWEPPSLASTNGVTASKTPKKVDIFHCGAWHFVKGGVSRYGQKGDWASVEIWSNKDHTSVLSATGANDFIFYKYKR